jgi:hypothetical protein
MRYTVQSVETQRNRAASAAGSDGQAASEIAIFLQRNVACDGRDLDRRTGLEGQAEVRWSSAASIDAFAVPLKVTTGRP